MLHAYCNQRYCPECSKAARRDAAGKIFDQVDTLQQFSDLAEKAEKFQTALHKALLALADEAEDVQK